MKKTKNQKGIFSFYGNIELIEKLKTYAIYKKIPLSRFIDEALSDWIKKTKDFDSILEIQKNIDLMIESYKKEQDENV